MIITEIETQRRFDIVHKEIEAFKPNSSGIILVGSLAYGAYHSITKDSDIDLIVIADNIKDYIPFVTSDPLKRDNLKNRFFEGYCIKKEVDGVPVSYHILSTDAFDIIVKCFVADIRVFRASAKEEIYNLYGFEGNHYPYKIKNIILEEFDEGVRTIVPIGFINCDRYYLGIHRDKLLTNPHVLFDPKGLVEAGLDKLWQTISHNLCDESFRKYGGLHENMSVLNMLAKREKMRDDVVAAISEKSKLYIEPYLKTKAFC